MRARSIVVPVLVAALALVLAACASTPPPAITNPAAVLRALPAAASQAGSVRFVEVTSAKGFRSTLTGQLSASDMGDAQEHLIQGKSELDLERVGFTMFIRGSAQVLESSLGLSPQQATPYAGRWVSVSSGDLDFGPLSATLNLKPQVSAFIPSSTVLTVGGVRTLRHTVVVPISGSPSKSIAQGSTGTVTLFVSKSAPHLPAAAALTLHKGSRSETRIVAFTHWGAPVHLTVPPGAVSYRTIALGSAG